jgi:hypothetical protein
MGWGWSFGGSSAPPLDGNNAGKPGKKHRAAERAIHQSL